MTSQRITRRDFLKLKSRQQTTLNSTRQSTKHYLLDADGYTLTENFFRRRIGFLPQINTAQWALRISGMVETPLSLNYASLMKEPQIEIAATILCQDSSSSNFLMGNARWQGILFQNLIDQAQVKPESNAVQFIAGDGYMMTFPLDQLDRAVLAFSMNGEPLKPDHGYPARIILPGQYGQKMPKWIQRIEFIDTVNAHANTDDDVAVIAAILNPKPFEPVERSITLSGVAYAGDRTIFEVELSVDDGPWMPVQISGQSPFSWTQWHIDWTAPAPGDYLFKVRAADNSGFTQTQEHTVVIRVAK